MAKGAKNRMAKSLWHLGCPTETPHIPCVFALRMPIKERKVRILALAGRRCSQVGNWKAGSGFASRPVHFRINAFTFIKRKHHCPANAADTPAAGDPSLQVDAFRCFFSA